MRFLIDKFNKHMSGAVQGQSKSMPNTAKLQKGMNLGSTRHSDPGSSALERLEQNDATLSGDLDGLTFHLESARAMYSHNGPSNTQPGRMRMTGDYPGNAQGKMPVLPLLNLVISKLFHFCKFSAHKMKLSSHL